MKPMPPVTTRRAMTSSLHLDVPIVWDVLRIVGDPELVRLLVVVQLRWEVHEVHRFGYDRLETVDDVRRDLDQHGVPLARKELVHLAFRRGPVAIVVADDLCRPAHHDEMIRLLLVIVPALHDPGVSDRDVRLREPLELRPIGAEHFHEVAPFVVDLFERPDDDALDQIHGGLPGIGRRYIFVHLERVLALSSMRKAWRASSTSAGQASSDSTSARRRFGAVTK